VTHQRRFWICLALIVGIFVFQGVHLARRMVTWGDESAYLTLGYLATSGNISLFQDEMRGQRLPLPFYVLGTSQLLWGRGLLPARLLSLVFGGIAVVCVAIIARRLKGDTAGLLAALFLGSQGVMAGFFASAVYHGLAAAILTGGLALILCVRSPAGPVAGMAVVSLLFLIRGSLWPILPAILVALLVQAKSRLERGLLVAAAGAVPAAFFLSDVRHLKVLAYVPLVNRLVESLGYHAVFPLIGHRSQESPQQLLGVLRLVRMYEYWALAAALLVAAICIRRWRGRDVRPFFDDRRTMSLTLLLAFTFLAQLPVYGDRFRELAGLFPSFAPLLPLLLGIGYVTLLEQKEWSAPGWRLFAIGGLTAILVAPLMIVRHPLLPSGADAGATPLADLDRAARHLHELIPPGTKVFLYGYAIPLYLADRVPYYRQIHDPNSLASVEDHPRIQRNGLWGLAEMEAWLGTDAEYAVIMPVVVTALRPTRPVPIARMEALLAQHFERIARVDEYRWWVCDVYRRRAASTARGAPG
jgi:4-amino-4-deoxy-L-arabinose transferase-like glycosyltransferase